LLLDHGMQETRLLRNMGYDAPAPILSQYDWGSTPPYESQKETAGLLTMNKRAYVLSTMGTGKTRAALYAADYLISTAQVRKVLVVAPLSTLTPTWMNEVFFHFHHRSATVVYGTKKKRRKLLAEDSDFYIINHDGLPVILPELLERDDIDLIILDELAMYRDASTDRWKITKKLLNGRAFVWGLTGAPTPNAPTDAYAQIKLLQPNKVGSYTRFRSDTMVQLTQFKWIARKDAPEKVHALMQPSVRFKLSDCTDIPPTTYTTRELKLSPQQEKFYKRLDSAAAAAYAEHTITAANEAVVMGKLLQVSCGYVYTDDRRVLGLQPKAKIKELLNILEETERKTIVFVPYTHALHSVAAAVSNEHESAVIDGSVPKKARDKIFYEFQNSDNPRVIVAHPKTMSHGLTLTASATIVWFCPFPSLDVYIQANARIVRGGQEHHTNIIHLQSTPVEKKVFQRLRNNERVQGSLLELYEGAQDYA
jgi:SNF2 family DNA or RNA helicase